MSECTHFQKIHLCSNGPSSGGSYFWCPNCGCLGRERSIVRQRQLFVELLWRSPDAEFVDPDFPERLALT